jgi:hypothetical protein
VGRSAPNAFPHREQIVEIGGRDGPDPGGATGSRATATTCQPALASSAAVAPHNSRCQQSAWCASSLHLLFFARKIFTEVRARADVSDGPVLHGQRIRRSVMSPCIERDPKRIVTNIASPLPTRALITEVC